MTTDLTAIAKFGSTYGIQGALKLYSFTEIKTELSRFTRFFIQDKREFVPLKITFRYYRDCFLAQIETITTPEAAQPYVDQLLYTPKDDLPTLSPGQFYWEELTQLLVLTTNGVTLGRITELLATGANDVMIVQGAKRHLIPYLAQVVQEVDLVNGQIVVDWDPDF